MVLSTLGGIDPWGTANRAERETVLCLRDDNQEYMELPPEICDFVTAACQTPRSNSTKVLNSPNGNSRDKYL